MARDHWVVIPDGMLKLIEDGPDVQTMKTVEQLSAADLEELWAWVEDVQDAILDGLETA
jgi:hypothetical protein